MKAPILALSALGILSSMGILLAGCDRKAAVELKSDSKPAPAPIVPRHAFAASDSFQAGLGKVYEGYVNIESALAHDDFDQAQKAFQSMHGSLHMIPTGGLDSAGKADWDSLDAAFMRVLHPMAASENIAAMRDHFIDFSPLVLDALEKFGGISASKVFLFHCPEARNNQGADWLQRDTALLNPYFGKTMPQCGALVREVRLN